MKKERKLTKKEIIHVKKIQKSLLKLIRFLEKIPPKDRELFNLISEFYGKKPLDYEKAIKSFKALEEGCKKTIKME